MKFLCSNCKAKYQIADEKVIGRTLRMTCRQCKQEIVIRGDAPVRAASGPVAMPSMPAPAPSPLAVDFQRQLGGPVRASLAPPPPLLDAWHVAINEVPVGPMRREDVARRIAAGAINPESLAWREGLDDWLPVRQIPELAVLLGAAAPPPVPFVPAMPGQRADMAPMGGRAGAAPAFSLDDWAPPAPDPTASHALRASPMTVMTDDGVRGARAQPLGLIVFGIGLFALLMSAMTIFGARWLRETEQPGATAPAAAAVTGPTEPAAPTTPAPSAEDPSDDDAPEMVIELDDVGVQDQAPSRTGPRTSTATSGTKTSGGAKKDLTDAEKAMLARMGGGADPTLTGIGTKTNNPRTSGGGAQAGGLTADQLSKVVMQGRKNLQRCYESALRGSGSDETIRLDVEITISPSGNVTAVRTGDGGLPGMKECVQRTVKMWRFPNAGDSTQTKFPLVFQPGA